MYLKVVLCISALFPAAFAGPFLSPREEQLINENIALISTNIPEHAMNIFIDMFTARPEYQNLFKNFKDTPFSNLRSDPALIRHSVNILTTIATVVSSLMHDHDVLYNKFIEVAEHHIPRRVNADHVAVLKDVVIGYLQRALTGAMSPNDLNDLLTAWDKIFITAMSAFRRVN